MSFIVVGFYDGIFQRPVCFSNNCLGFFIESFTTPFTILSFFGKLITLVVSVFAVFIAIHTYKENVKSNFLSTYLSHYSTFQSYAVKVIAMTPRINVESVDIYFLYNFIFPDAKDGSYNPSKGYIDFVQTVSFFITSSNDMYSGGMQTMLPFKDHQRRLNDIMKTIRVSIPLKPNKTDFFRVEADYYSLLNQINGCFCNQIEALPCPNYS